MPATILIDGSQGEGGGQIQRTAMALAALLRQPVKIDNSRANRSQPGLKTQHLAGVNALAEIISKFLPARIKVNAGSGRVDIAGTGAI